MGSTHSIVDLSYSVQITSAPRVPVPVTEQLRLKQLIVKQAFPAYWTG